MKKSAKNRTEYQEFLYSLMEDYGIDKPKASWSNSEWKEVVNYRLNNADIKSFHEQLTAFNIKTPTNEIWTHVSDDEEEERIADAKRAEEKRIADAKKVEEENALLIKELEKEEEKRIADAKKVEEEFKQCPFCAENIKIEAIFCKHCKSSFNEEKEKEKKNSKKKKKSEKVTKNYLWFLVIIGLLGGYWISLGKPDISLIINKSNRESSCLRVVKRERDRTVFLFNDSSIYMDDSWFAKGKLVVSLRQRSNNNKGYNSVLCIAHKNRSVTILPASQESNWR